MKRLLLLMLGLMSAGTVLAASKPNVLFIAIDDLRPELGCYDATQMVTPNLDHFATQSRLFLNHFVQVPTCGASRYAMLTGHYPKAPAALSNGAFVLSPKTKPATPYSLPMLFKEHGYETVSLGKITHSPDGLQGDDKKAKRTGNPELPFSWDVLWGPTGEWKDAWAAFFGYAHGKTRDRKTTPAFEHEDVDDTGYPDGLTANEAIRQLNRLKDKPFFLAVGFFKPHLPFNAPQKYWNLYDQQKITLAPYRKPPAGVNPKISLHKSGELFGQYAFDGKKVLMANEHQSVLLRHAYYAATSYSDVQAGKVLAELDRLGLSQNTIVVIWGDHGWHLGDHGIWGKHTLYERALRSAFMIRTPGMQSPGQSTDAIVQTVDIFPTLADLCGLTPPAGLDGRSLAPLLNNPKTQWQQEAHSFWKNGAYTGQSLRTRQYRLTRWVDKTGTEVQVELYDHASDPLETKNVAKAHPDIVKQLSVDWVK